MRRAADGRYSLLELFDEGLVDLQAEVLHRRVVVGQNHGRRVVRELAFGLGVAVG